MRAARAGLLDGLPCPRDVAWPILSFIVRQAPLREILTLFGSRRGETINSQATPCRRTNRTKTDESHSLPYAQQPSVLRCQTCTCKTDAFQGLGPWRTYIPTRTGGMSTQLRCRLGAGRVHGAWRVPRLHQGITLIIPEYKFLVLRCIKGVLFVDKSIQSPSWLPGSERGPVFVKSRATQQLTPVMSNARKRPASAHGEAGQDLHPRLSHEESSDRLGHSPSLNGCNERGWPVTAPPERRAGGISQDQNCDW
ncbi:uncharacterized protein B0H64DRAFT_49587 [Chaetomium fimeti]|uniref:Uncharacterized protein n=1 Tax=Chaetomium fimeti TaxID=1854472 RepID=A0AAE0LN22_9PEZI|nr:hypothetical protein B0H64DRAFT_49587 [Chaetomium fimeti]